MPDTYRGSPISNPFSAEGAPGVEPEYVGFWARVGASIIDSLLIGVVSLPILTAIYGPDYLESDRFMQGPADVFINFVAPAFVVVLFWRFRQATPGKMLLSMRIVDAESFAPVATGRYVVRYLGYLLSTLPLGLGFLWVAFDPRKQGWHDKLAHTVVISTETREHTAAPPRATRSGTATRVFGGVVAGIVLVIGALLALVTFYSGPELSVDILAPESVAVGEAFVVRVEVSNPHGEDVVLDSIDIDDVVFEAFDLLSVSPPPTAESPIELIGQKSWGFQRVVSPGGVERVEFELVGSNAGTFQLAFDVCNTYQDCSRTPVSIGVESPATHDE